MAVQLTTSRGIYAMTLAREPERSSDALVLTLSLERRDGIEKVALRCRIASELLGGVTTQDVNPVLARLVPWIERDFEMTRELALKTIRSERKLVEVAFDESNRGPF